MDVWVGALLLGPLLWLVGAWVFDGVHWLLHVMLRSRSRWLRALAWPHAVHHEWIGADLQPRMEWQLANVFCHIVPEFLTQLAFTGVVALLLPGPWVTVLLVLQAAIFLYILSCRGLDPNHRPIALLDAHPPGLQPLPPYHALHHVHPDAHYSSYTKLVDWLVGGGIPPAGRRLVTRGEGGELARALLAGLRGQGVAQGGEPADAEVLLLLDPDADPSPEIEALARATRERLLPPEVWCLRTRPDAALRHYLRDPRVQLRILMAVPGVPPEAAARHGLRWMRRGFHVVPMAPWWKGLRAWHASRRTPAVAPPEAPRVCSRSEWAASFGG